MQIECIRKEFFSLRRYIREIQHKQ
jgi:hypothetical protein